MTDYKPGDRVRVTFEGTVHNEPEGNHISLLRDDKDGGDFEYLNTNGLTIEKITPDYKAQIEALEPGTAFVLTVNHLEIPYLRTNTGVVTQLGSKYTVEGILALTGTVDNLRILK